ncbi:aldehyde dehydrogenase family protein [Dickeya ananatis]|uniref:aldehyde dehydrogenase family protein n=1 Tax=Dickeya ananatis TaxID=3061286 RepID=UPI00388F2123
MQTQQYDSLYLFINGQWLTAGDRDTSAVINPANGTTLGRLPLATNADLDQALITAGESFHVWRNTVPDERARIMKKAAVLMRERAEHIATLMTQEEGKPLSESRDEVQRAADYFEWFAEEARRIDGRVVPANRPGVQQLGKTTGNWSGSRFYPVEFPGNHAGPQTLSRTGSRLQRDSQTR